jgi:hypothetical protein
MNKPAGVIVIAILYFLGAALCLIFGLLFIAGGGFLATILKQQGEAGASGLASILAGLGAVIGVVFVVFCAIDVLVGWGLLTLKNWARIVAIVFSIIGLCFQAFSLMRALTHLGIPHLIIPVVVIAIHGLIIWYLLKPEVKAAFQGAPMQAASA